MVERFSWCYTVIGTFRYVSSEQGAAYVLQIEDDTDYSSTTVFSASYLNVYFRHTVAPLSQREDGGWVVQYNITSATARARSLYGAAHVLSAL